MNQSHSEMSWIKGVVIGTAAVGVVGLTLSLLWGGYGFVPIFVIGLAFLGYAWQSVVAEQDQNGR